jgi:hypothetical protein
MEEVIMSKKIVKWTVDGSILKLSKVIGSNEIATIEAEFDVALIFPNYNDMTDVQKQMVLYATKQKLMDTGASSIGDANGKISAAKEKFAELIAGKWEGDRVNATGAKENKEAIARVKEASKAITLEGLLTKKVAYPATFTEVDEAKLQEFLNRIKKH